MARDRTFLREVPFAKNEYGSIVQTAYPGAHDKEYRSRMASLIEASRRVWPEIPQYSYTDDERSTWKLVSEVLLPLQNRYSCAAYIEGRDKLNIPLEKLPQLQEVSAIMEATTGFLLAPVGGLLDQGEFLSMLANKVMRCTPYIRHHSFPFFTPEPDILHEIRGHAPMFMHQPFVDMSMEIGRAAQRAVEKGNAEVLDLIGLFYWYTVEYGLIQEKGEIKVFGAGNNGGVQDLLRSIDPMIEKRPFSVDAIREMTIDYDAPQEIFFVAESYEQITEAAREVADMV